MIDPLYGIDGFRNVDTLSDLNSIPNLRRRAGMVVGISGGTQYYKLNPGPWTGTITDWTIFNSGGGGGAFTGGTVTGDTIFTQGVTATTFSASTYLGLPLDVFVTGYTYQDNTFTISDSSGNTFSTTIDVMTGLTVNGVLSANTLNVNNVSITGDTYTTGGTYSNGILDFYSNNGGSYQVTGLYTGQTSYVNSLTTGIGLSGDSTTGNITIINTDPDQIVTISGGTNVDVTGTYPNFNIALTGLSDNNVYTTGFTYQDNTLAIS